MLCRGSVNLLRRVPTLPATKYSEDGEIAHEILAVGLKNNAQKASQAIALSRYANATFDLSFKASITTALDYVYELIDALMLGYGDPLMYVETFVNPPISSAPGEAAGYCDVAIYSEKAKHLWVIDYKHGVGISKAVEGNTQVKQYAAGFLFDDRRFIRPTTVGAVTMVIIQPRAFHKRGDIREYEVPTSDISEYLSLLDDVVYDCLKEDAPLTPGEDQCRFCDARPICPALSATSLAVLDPHIREIGQLSKERLEDPDKIDTQRLSYIKQMRPLIMEWLNSVDAAIENAIFSGDSVPGFKAVEAKASRKWYGEEQDRVRKLASIIGVPDWELYDVTPKTLTEVEGMIVSSFKSRVSRKKKKQAAEEARQFFAYFTDKKSTGKLTIVPEKDARPAVDKALQSFQQLPAVPPPPTT